MHWSLIGIFCTHTSRPMIKQPKETLSTHISFFFLQETSLRRWHRKWNNCHQLLFVLGKGWRRERKFISLTATVWAQRNRNQAENQGNSLNILSSSSLSNGLSYTDWPYNGFLEFFPVEEPRLCTSPSAKDTKEGGYQNATYAVGKRVNFLPIKGPLSR